MDVRHEHTETAEQTRTSLLREGLHRFGVIRSTIAVSLACVVASMVIPWLWWSIVNPDLVRFGVMIGVICASIIAPPLMYALASLSNELDTSEAAVRHTHDQLQDALNNAHELSGMLRICASCKKVRDDKGYWSQVEVYVRDRSEAEFSHGICPDCMKKLYGR